MPSAKTVPLSTSTGGAVLAKMKLSTDQPPNAPWAKLFDCGEGRLYVTPAVNALRMSKSEFPRSIFGFATELGVLR